MWRWRKGYKVNNTFAMHTGRKERRNVLHMWQLVNWRKIFHSRRFVWFCLCMAFAAMKRENFQFFPQENNSHNNSNRVITSGKCTGRLTKLFTRFDKRSSDRYRLPIVQMISRQATRATLQRWGEQDDVVMITSHTWLRNRAVVSNPCFRNSWFSIQILYR